LLFFGFSEIAVVVVHFRISGSRAAWTVTEGAHAGAKPKDALLNQM
jgi:hypothetical protein